ncbi:hypothetical protein EVG20_g11681, partial [Dentipellis fragilis]
MMLSVDAVAADLDSRMGVTPRGFDFLGWSSVSEDRQRASGGTASNASEPVIDTNTCADDISSHTDRKAIHDTDTFSRKHGIYIPGDDPSSEAQSRFVSIAIESEAAAEDNGSGAADTKDDGEPAAAIETKPKVVSWVEWQCMIEICKISKSVVEAAQSVGPEPSEPLFKTYDTSNWPVQPGIKPEGECKTDEEAMELEDPEKEKAGDRPDGGIYAVNSRTEQFVAISDATLEKKIKISDADKKVRAGFVGHCSWADLVVPIEVKVDRSRAAFTFADKRDHFLLEYGQRHRCSGADSGVCGTGVHPPASHACLRTLRFPTPGADSILRSIRLHPLRTIPYGTGTDTPPPPLLLEIGTHVERGTRLRSHCR